MNEYLKKFRAQYPEYDDMPDAELALALHAKFYADMPYEEFQGRIGLDTGVGRAWETDGPDLSHLDPMGITKMSMGEFRDKAGPAVQMALGGVGLQSAVKAIRGLRAAQAAARAPMVPSPSGLVGASGNPLMVRGAPIPPRTAMDGLRALAKNPFLRGALAATGADAVVRKIF